ncbi:thymidine kinase [Patescibacteria group bacterium]|nr:thymidine kinase [Patescibacteria group bacterium]MBU1868775.1 thymidine kinase [Patescibacteria group bacterium]
MYSGKTLRLVLDAAYYEHYAGYKVQVFKHGLDAERYSIDSLDSHTGIKHPAVAVYDSSQIRALIEPETRVIIIDEANFFDEGLPVLVRWLADEGRLVIVGGLDMDSFGTPFGPMPDLLAMADQVVKCHAACDFCGRPATYTWRRPNAPQDQVLVGGKSLFKAACRTCYRTQGQEKGKIS